MLVEIRKTGSLSFPTTGLLLCTLANVFSFLYLLQFVLLGAPKFFSAPLYTLFVLLLLGGSQFFLFRRARSQKEILHVESISRILVVLLTILVGTSDVFSLLSKPLTVSNPLEQANVIIVLGGPWVEKKMDYAVHLYNLGYAKRIYSMMPFQSQYLTKKYGVTAQAIRFPSIPPLDTYAEACLSKAYLAENHYRKAILITRPFHMRRAQMTFRKQGIEVYCAPVPKWYDEATRTSGIERFLRRHNWTREVSREYIGIAYYWLRGRL